MREGYSPSHIQGQYYLAARYLGRFYGGAPDADHIRYGKKVSGEFSQALESLG